MALQDPDQDGMAQLCSEVVQNSYFSFSWQYNSEVGTRVCGEPIVQPWILAHAHHGLVLMVCFWGLTERWQHRVCIALRKALMVLLSGVIGGGGGGYGICPDPEKVDFFFFLFIFLGGGGGGIFFPQVSEEKVMITIREIARGFPYLGTVVTSP